MNDSDAERAVSFVTLRDGRRLAYAVFGSPDGKPVLLFHGHPGSRLDAGIIGDAALRQHGLRVIAPDRPGIGMSDFQPGRRIVDWPADAGELAEALGIQQFGVMGLSCGGPFAAATAHALPHLATRLALVSSVGRFDIPEGTQGMGAGLMYFRLARYAPWLSRRMVRMMANGMKANRQEMIARMKSGLPPADIAAMDNQVVLAAFMASLEEFFRPDPAGLAWEAGLIMRPWGFMLEEIRVPTYLWHGEEDRNAPVAMGRDLARRIPGCAAQFLPGEGHFSLLVNHSAEILDALAG
jgi:pimeloyl-ACP methyl ester carboxylesterase